MPFFKSVKKIFSTDIWDKVFKSGLSKCCGRPPLKNLLSPLLNFFSHIISEISRAFFFFLKIPAADL